MITILFHKLSDTLHIILCTQTITVLQDNHQMDSGILQAWECTNLNKARFRAFILGCTNHELVWGKSILWGTGWWNTCTSLKCPLGTCIGGSMLWGVIATQYVWVFAESFNIVIMSKPASFTSCPLWFCVIQNMSKMGERSLGCWVRSRASIVGKFLASGQ